MANIKSSAKDIRRIHRRTERNQQIKSRLKTLRKKVEAAAQADNAEETKSAAVAYIAALDKAAKTHVVHANRARRHKALYSRHVFARQA